MQKLNKINLTINKEGVKDIFTSILLLSLMISLGFLTIKEAGITLLIILGFGIIKGVIDFLIDLISGVKR